MSKRRSNDGRRVLLWLALAGLLPAVLALPSTAGSSQKPSLPPSSFPLPPPDASPSTIFKPDVGKPFTQTGPRIEYHPPGGVDPPGAICGPGEIRGMNGRCIR